METPSRKASQRYSQTPPTPSAGNPNSSSLRKQTHLFQEAGHHLETLRDRFYSARRIVATERSISLTSESAQARPFPDIHSASSLSGSFQTKRDPSADIKQAAAALKDARRAMNDSFDATETYMDELLNKNSSLNPSPLKVSPQVHRIMTDDEMFLNPRPAPPTPTQKPPIPPRNPLRLSRRYSEYLSKTDLSAGQKENPRMAGAGNNGDRSGMMEAIRNFGEDDFKWLHGKLMEIERQSQKKERTQRWF